MNWKWNSIEGSQKGVAVFCGPLGTVRVVMQSFSDAKSVADLIEAKIYEAVVSERTLAARRAQNAILHVV